MFLELTVSKNLFRYVNVWIKIKNSTRNIRKLDILYGAESLKFSSMTYDQYECFREKCLQSAKTKNILSKFKGTRGKLA